jgi:pimeloyl-ACP methyl ester carboxylesterase
MIPQNPLVLDGHHAGDEIMTMLTTRDGTQLYTKVHGTPGQGRPVILIHGWPLNCDSWDRIGLALAEAGFTAIAYDRRGFGRSDQPWHGYDYDTFADDLADVMAFHGVESDAALVGFSMGGGEIARYMSRHDGRGVSQAVLISSVVPYLLRDDSNPEGVPEATLAEMTQGMRDDRAHFFVGFFKLVFGVGLVSRPVSQQVLDWAWSMAMQAGLHPTLAAAQAFATTDFRGDLPAITVPTLIIHGTADKTVPIDATGREVARRLPRALLIEYNDEPHGVIATQTHALSSDLITFLSGGLESVESGLRQAVIDEVTAQSLSTSMP